MKVLRATDYRRMPWKNGGGETREIMISPAGATLDSLDWRLSLATVATDGPFSSFPGVQRTLCVIDGAGIRLQIGDAPARTLLEDSEPHTFDGEVATIATLVDGAIVDLNVMSRRDRSRHDVQRLTVEGALQLAVHARPTIIFCQRGELRCRADDDSALLAAEDCVVIDAATSVSLDAVERAQILVIELFSHKIT
ncbi:MAG TPA: HutD family protein [Steroidobacter sp.]|uniref:HutD/Ves family protein n=1 Tax=Steroidobacter sp. TaxID=1978227 RepID=UPI002ED833EB